MNLKQAKALRRIARGSGLPAQTQYARHRKRGNRVVAPDCIRGLYLRLKRFFKKGEQA